MDEHSITLISMAAKLGLGVARGRTAIGGGNLAVRIAMMGSGGIGGYIGLRLAQAGHDVAFIARGAHLEAMRKHGLHLNSPLGDVHQPTVVATDNPADIGPVDVVSFAVKTYDTEKAALAIHPLVDADARVVTFQNGIDSVATLSKYVPREQVFGGATYMSVDLEQPGRLLHRGHTRAIIGGAGDNTIHAFKAACDQSIGIDLDITQDIHRVLWEKFITISAFSGATSLMRATAGAILANPEARLFLEQLRNEGMAIAAAAGQFMAPGFEDRVMAVWANLPPDTLSSMAHDLARGKPIEVEWLSGRMHHLGRELGVATPGHSTVYRALHMHARGAPQGASQVTGHC